MENKFQVETTHENYKKDEAAQVNADVDKDLAGNKRTQEEMLKEITDRMNHEIMDMVQHNDSFMRFIHVYLKSFFEWGADNHLEFWEVGIDGSQSWFSHDGKTIMMKPCHTERNPNPLTGEKKQGGIILPKGM